MEMYLPPAATLAKAGYPSYLGSYSALDCYFGSDSSTFDIILTQGDLIALSRLFDELTFPGFPLEHAAARIGNRSIFFRCADEIDPWQRNPFTVLDLRYDPHDKVFLDPHGVYRDLRRVELVPVLDIHADWVRLTEAARLVSRYHYTADAATLTLNHEPPPVAAGYQRQILTDILTAPHPEKGLDLLLNAGLIDLWWPELSALTTVDHSKDHHPEGGGWQHTLATFSYRKRPDMELSLALLLHDIGKPCSRPMGKKRFYGHADIGAQVATRFLKRLGFEESVVRQVAFLVLYHMIPGAMRKEGHNPGMRDLIERLMTEPSFPQLLELYRADTLATFASPDQYYRACRIYRSYRGTTSNDEPRFSTPPRTQKNRLPHEQQPIRSGRRRLRRRRRR